MIWKFNDLKIFNGILYICYNVLFLLYQFCNLFLRCKKNI